MEPMIDKTYITRGGEGCYIGRGGPKGGGASCRFSSANGSGKGRDKSSFPEKTKSQVVGKGA